MAELALTIALALSYALDGHSILVRSHEATEKKAELLALSNLVQYFARIITVISIFVISALTEGAHIQIDSARIFAGSSLCAVIVFLLIIGSQRFANGIVTLIKPAVMLSFPALANQTYWTKLPPDQQIRLTVASFVTNFLLLLAAFLPFLIASTVPQYRMTSVYAGQLLNFGASAIVLTIQDPHAMRMLDCGRAGVVRHSVLRGRLLSHAAAVFVFGAVMLFT